MQFNRHQLSFGSRITPPATAPGNCFKQKHSSPAPSLVHLLSYFYLFRANCFSVSNVILGVCIPVFVIIAIITIFIMMKRKNCKRCHSKKTKQNKSSAAVSYKNDCEMNNSNPKVDVYAVRVFKATIFFRLHSRWPVVVIQI